MLPDVMKISNPIGAVAACLALAAVLSAGAAGCGSIGGASPDGGGGGGAAGAGTITWQDDGVAQQTLFASASLVAASGLQILQVAGGEPTIGIAFGVSAKPTVELGSFPCGPGPAAGYPITSFSYTASGVDPLFVSCTVSITALGAATGEHVSGTFSAVLNKTAGGTKALTAGVFNLTLNVSP